MADPSVFKLFRTVDPNTVNVPIKEKFAKLTLSSNKKKQLEQRKDNDRTTTAKSNVSRQLLTELSDAITLDKSYEHPLLRSDSSSSLAMGLQAALEATPTRSTQLDVSECMEVLQLSGEDCTQQQKLDQDVERLSTQVSNLTMQSMPSTQLPQPDLSICISSTTEDDGEADEEEVNSCITISDTSGSECAAQPNRQLSEVVVEESMEVSAQQVRSTDEPTGQLSLDKVERIQAFLRDISFERRCGVGEATADQLLHSNIASADTQSMSQEVDVTQLPSPTVSPAASPQRPLDSSKLLADNETELNTMCSEEQLSAQESSKRLADNDTEVNTMCSEEQLSAQESSKRLADNDTEVNTMCSEEQLSELGASGSKRLALNDTEVNTLDMESQLLEQSAQSSTLDDVDPNESVTIPETCSEAEQSPPRPRSTTSTQATSDSDETELDTPAIQVSSINISAKINIKIHIPQMDSSSGESDTYSDTAAQDGKENRGGSSSAASEKQEKSKHRQEQNSSVLCEDASEDEQFLTNAEQLLNQLYGKAWQTPDVIRTLKRSSGSGGKVAATTDDRTPLAENRRQPRPRRGAATTAKKRLPVATVNESALGDFSLFQRALHAKKLNSTQMPMAPRTERAASKQRVRTNHVHEERWRALVDSDSGTDASDDEDADATDFSDNENAGQVTYLDLTKAEVEVVSNPDSDSDAERKSPGFPKKLDDILRTCRATVKPKLSATPSTPTATGNPTRRQLFTPNTGYEDDQTAKKIVEQAIDLDSLDQLEVVYLPGSTVHKRVQEVKKQLGIAVESPKAKPVFKLPTPRATPISKSLERNTKMALPKSKTGPNGKYSFIKSLEGQISRDQCDNEALFFRENFARNRENLTKRLYEIFNEAVFHNRLVVPITWSKLLRNTAGRCINKSRLNERTCVVELSIKVLTSADRLRCTLIHELCHAATWIFDGKCGHGHQWKMWAHWAVKALPDLPPINVCHSYAIEFKYTYKCNTCDIRSNSHTRTRKVEKLRCGRCGGPIVLQLNKKDKQGNIVPTPVRQATGFAKYVKDNFKKHKRDNLTAAQVMRILSVEYAKEKQNRDSAEEQAEQVGTLTLH